MYHAPPKEKGEQWTGRGGRPAEKVCFSEWLIHGSGRGGAQAKGPQNWQPSWKANREIPRLGEGGGHTMLIDGMRISRS